MNKLFSSLAAAALLSCVGIAQASPVLYSHIGTQNTQQYTFTAQSTGEVMAYFLGSTAAYTDVLTMLVNGVAMTAPGINNKTATNNQAFDFGLVQAGDTLVFKLTTISGATGVGPWYSQTSMNSDGINHIYSSVYGGDNTIPAGTYVAFEDLPKGGDFNYNDMTFLFTNVATNAASNVPEPGTLALLGLGVAGVAASRRKRKA